MGVSSLVLLHNHPSGDPTPSKEDLRLARQLVDAAKLLDLRIHDHVVIVGNGTDPIKAATARRPGPLDTPGPSPYRSAMPLPPRLAWQNPGLTVRLVLRRILTEPWSDEAWREIRKEIPSVLRERERIRREGWFN